MKRKIYKAVSFILTLSLVAVCSLAIPAYSYAAGDSMTLWDYISQFWSDPDSWGNTTGKKATDYLAYAASQLGAIYSHDFDSWVQNEDTASRLFLDNDLSYDESTGNVIFSDNFMKQLKQALKDYAKETDNSYFYAWSTGFDDIPYTEFCSFKPAYDTVKNVLDTVPGGRIKLYINGGEREGKYIVSIWIQQIDISKVGFVYSNRMYQQYAYDTWSSSPADLYCLMLFPDDEAATSWEDFKLRSFGINKRTDFNEYHNGDFSFYDESSTSPYRCSSTFNSEDRISADFSAIYNNHVVTRTRETYRIYRSLDEFINYTLGKRHVYFTNGFWNTDPGEITASLDDLANATDRMNDTLEKLLDKIDDNTDEKTIEELLQQILDEMKNQGSGGDTGGGTGGGSSGGSWSDGAIDGLFGYLEEIIDELGIMIGQLDWIGVTLEDMTVEQVEDKTDSFIDQLVSTFREVSDLLKTKFPFSIP